MRAVQYLIICLLVAGLCAFLAYYRKQAEKYRLDNVTADPGYGHLKAEVNRIIREVIYARPEDLSISSKEAKKRQKNKEKLSIAKRDAPVGDQSAKRYLLDFISTTLITQLGVTEGNICGAIPFDREQDLDTYHKYVILMLTMKETFGENTWEYLMRENGLDALRENGRYEIYDSDIDRMYEKYVRQIPFLIQLGVLTQRIYEDLYGHGHADLLLEQNVEDISVGLAGVPAESVNHAELAEKLRRQPQYLSYNSVVLLSSGKSIHLRFLGMGSQQELVRVCKHIYLFRRPGQLSEEKGFIENDMADGSRVTVFRTRFSDSWGFLVRKHKEGQMRRLEELYRQKGAGQAALMLRLLMKGCQPAVISGQMYAGKTTLLMALCEAVNPNYNLRVLESVFELWLRKLFPDRDVASFMERTDISGEKALEFLKRTNGTVLILGELIKEMASNWLISAAQSGFKFILSTGHWVTTQAMMKWLLNAKMNTSGAGSEALAAADIAEAIHFDIHCGLDELAGERYLERITEIVPTGDGRVYEIRDVMVYDAALREYRFVNDVSERTKKEMGHYLSAEEMDMLQGLFQKAGGAA